MAEENSTEESTAGPQTPQSEEPRHVSFDTDQDNEASTNDQLYWKGKPTNHVSKLHLTCYMSAYTRPVEDIWREILEKADVQGG